MAKENMWFTQYRECHEQYRQIKRFMWQIPSALAAINGSLVVVVFTLMDQSPLWARELVLAVALILSVGLLCVQRRHRYFSKILTATLASIEKSLGVSHIQHTAMPQKYDEIHKDGIYTNALWGGKYSPTFIDGPPGENLLSWVMLGMCGLITLAIIYLPFWSSEANKFISWIPLIIASVIIAIMMKIPRKVEEKGSQSQPED